MREIKFIRMRKHITQKELAEAVGVSPVTISRIESGRNQPSWNLANKIAEYLDCSLNDFGDLKADKKPAKAPILYPY